MSVLWCAIVCCLFLKFVMWHNYVYMFKCAREVLEVRETLAPETEAQEGEEEGEREATGECGDMNMCGMCICDVECSLHM